MSKIFLSFDSKYTKKNQRVNVIMPNGEVKYIIMLLHGLGGDENTIATKMDLETLSNQYNISFVLPNGDRSFYTLIGDNLDYYNYLKEEVWEYVKPLYPQPLSHYAKIIGGISMGGYGAWMQTLDTNDFYQGLILISPSLDIVSRDPIKRAIKEHRDEWISMFGDQLQPQYDLFQYQLNRSIKYYIACGQEDYLLEATTKFINHLYAHNLETQINIQPGKHNKHFFYPQLEHGIKTMVTLTNL